MQLIVQSFLSAFGEFCIGGAFSGGGIYFSTIGGILCFFLPAIYRLNKVYLLLEKMEKTTQNADNNKLLSSTAESLEREIKL